MHKRQKMQAITKHAVEKVLFFLALKEEYTNNKTLVKQPLVQILVLVAKKSLDMQIFSKISTKNKKQKTKKKRRNTQIWRCEK